MAVGTLLGRLVFVTIVGGGDVKHTDTFHTGRPLRDGGLAQVTSPCLTSRDVFCRPERRSSCRSEGRTCDFLKKLYLMKRTFEEINKLFSATGAVPGVPIQSDFGRCERPEDLRRHPGHPVLRQVQLRQDLQEAEGTRLDLCDSVVAQVEQPEADEPREHGLTHDCNPVSSEDELAQIVRPTEPAGAEPCEEVLVQAEVSQVRERTEGSFGDRCDTSSFNREPRYRLEVVTAQHSGVDLTNITQTHAQGGKTRWKNYEGNIGDIKGSCIKSIFRSLFCHFDHDMR